MHRHSGRGPMNMADGISGKPLWMASTTADMSESLAVVMRTSFHVIDLMSVVAVDAQICACAATWYRIVTRTDDCQDFVGRACG